MKVAVLGAGGVGCFYGGLLAKAGHHVTLIGRASHMEAVRARGLLFETAEGVEAIQMKAATGPEGAAGADLVLVCVKSGEVAEAGRQLRPHLAPGAMVLSFQNGADTAERLQAALGREVGPAAVYVAVEMAGAGHLKHHGRSEVALGPGPRSEEFAAMFRAAGIPTEISDNLAGALWAKMIMNCSYNALSAVPQLPYGRLVAVEGVRALMEDIVSECLAVTERLGIRVPGDVRGAVRGLAASMPNQSSSTAQDLARAKRSEIDHLNGHVVRLAEELGIPVPANRALWVMVKLMEEKAATDRT